MAESNGAIPDFMRPVVDKKPTSSRVVAEHAVLALNASMMGLYDASLETFKENMRDQVPIIVALFSGQGGQMILYRPGQPPEVAPPVPLVYQLAKSVGHSTMAIYEVVSPYVSDPRANQLWLAPLQMYRTQNQSALDGLAALDISERRPRDHAQHPGTQRGIHGPVHRQGELYLRGGRGVHPRHNASVGQDNWHRLGRAGGPLDVWWSRVGATSSATTGSASTR